MLMLTLAFVIVGCGNGTTPIDGPVEVTGVTVTGDRDLAIGGTTQLSAAVQPEDADQDVTWSSAQSDIASVDANGLVTGVSRGTTIIFAHSDANPDIAGQLRITVSEESAGETRPDLGGYTISIAQAEHALYELDPFHEDYTSLDQQARQDAWNWVEQNYNVQIEVVPYPPGIEWGPPRWNYILNQAALNVADYDFYTIPDNQIGTFVEGNALIDVTDWYALYGEDFMDSVYRGAGTYQDRLYSITDGSSGIYNVIYYNTNLLERLDMDRTPGEIFMDDEWTYTEFVNYAVEAQARLDALGDDNYVAVAGMPTYYWLGMVNAGNVNVANTNTLEMNLVNDTAIEAATALREIHSSQAMDTAFAVDQNVESWNQGRALFNSGDLWFVGTSNRWPSNLWGEGDETRYDYVPYPRPDEMATKYDQGIGLAGTATFGMPVGREHNYAGYPDTVTAENIYRALIETFLKTEEFRLDDPDYDPEVALRATAERYNASECSIEAFMFMAERTGQVGFFEPLSNSANPITHTGGGTMSVAIRSYITGQVDSYTEAVTPEIPALQEALVRAFA